VTLDLEAVRWARNRERYGLDAYALAPRRIRIPGRIVIRDRHTSIFPVPVAPHIPVLDFPDWFEFMSALRAVIWVRLEPAARRARMTSRQLLGRGPNYGDLVVALALVLSGDDFRADPPVPVQRLPRDWFVFEDWQP
jgi:hypothetical protein